MRTRLLFCLVSFLTCWTLHLTHQRAFRKIKSTEGRDPSSYFYHWKHQYKRRASASVDNFWTSEKMGRDRFAGKFKTFIYPSWVFNSFLYHRVQGSTLWTHNRSLLHIHVVLYTRWIVLYAHGIKMIPLVCIIDNQCSWFSINGYVYKYMYFLKTLLLTGTFSPPEGPLWT